MKEELPPFTWGDAQQNLLLSSEKPWYHFQRLNLCVCTVYSSQKTISCGGLM